MIDDDDDDENYFEVTETRKGKAPRVHSDEVIQNNSDAQTERWSKSRTERFDKWLSQSKNVHGDKYDYSKVEFTGIRFKVTIICPEHGEFKQVASSHSRGVGCPKCGLEKIRLSQKRLTTEELLSRFVSTHGDRYDYSKVKYVDYDTPVTIICRKHGEFEQNYYYHSSGSGCPKCGKGILTQEEIIAKFKEVHGDRYDYSKVEYVDTQTKVTIICPQHGEFEQKPMNHKIGTGCNRCSNATPIDIQLVVNLLCDGKSQVEIGKQIGVRPQLIGSRIKKLRKLGTLSQFLNGRVLPERRKKT